MNTTMAQYFFFLFSLVLTGYLLVVGKGILMPLIIAVFFWYLINALSHKIDQYTPMPSWAALTTSIVVIGLALFSFVDVVQNNIQSFAADLPAYQANTKKLLYGLADKYDPIQLVSIKALLTKINFGALAGGIVSALGAMTTMAMSILLYLVFLLLEQKTFSWKLDALVKDSKQRKKLSKVIGDIAQSLENYVGLKTLTSIVMGVLGYIVLVVLGVNNAVFWALIFGLLNFIPYLGPVIGVALPVLAAMAQLGEFSTPLFVLVGLGAIAFVIGNVVEPKLFGSSLNLSPLVLMLSLTVWGALWGIVGMILCIPIMVGLMIVLAQFDKTKWISVLMSERKPNL